MEKVIEADACKYNAIDLGLPSGLKWADRNVGAASPEAFGDYFAWGETKPRGENWATEAPYDWAHAPFTNGEEDYRKEYQEAHSRKWLEKGNVLKSKYDAAHTNMGGNWRMPTKEEIEELINGTIRSLETSESGINGIHFKSKVNNNGIFIPFAGFRAFSSICDVGELGRIWSISFSRLRLCDSLYSYGVGVECFSYEGESNRYYGLSIRGVHE